MCNKIYSNNYSYSIYNNLIKPTIWNNSYYTWILEITNLKKNLVTTYITWLLFCRLQAMKLNQVPVLWSRLGTKWPGKCSPLSYCRLYCERPVTTSQLCTGVSRPFHNFLLNLALEIEVKYFKVRCELLINLCLLYFFH